MKAEHQDLFRRDQQRLADWPPRFRGEGPFLPTGRRKAPRALMAVGALAVALLLSVAGTPWREALRPRAALTSGDARVPPPPTASAPIAK